MIREDLLHQQENYKDLGGLGFQAQVLEEDDGK